MKKILMMVIIFCFLFCGNSFAGVDSFLKYDVMGFFDQFPEHNTVEFSLFFENDVIDLREFSGTDKRYTNGIKFEFSWLGFFGFVPIFHN